jgi:RimJ/RimL family protein N-acetyltransferase
MPSFLYGSGSIEERSKGSVFMVRLLELDMQHATILERLFQIERDALHGYLAEEVLGWSISRLVMLGEETVGLIQVRQLNREAGYGMLGTWLVPKVWGTGVNREAKRKILRMVFDREEIQKVLICIEANNTRSVKAAEKLPYAEKIGGAEIPSDLAATGQGKNADLHVWFVITRERFEKYG